MKISIYVLIECIAQWRIAERRQHLISDKHSKKGIGLHMPTVQWASWDFAIIFTLVIVPWSGRTVESQDSTTKPLYRSARLDSLVKEIFRSVRWRGGSVQEISCTGLAIDNARFMCVNIIPYHCRDKRLHSHSKLQIYSADLQCIRPPINKRNREVLYRSSQRLYNIQANSIYVDLLIVLFIW